MAGKGAPTAGSSLDALDQTMIASRRAKMAVGEMHRVQPYEQQLVTSGGECKCINMENAAGQPIISRRIRHIHIHFSDFPTLIEIVSLLRTNLISEEHSSPTLTYNDVYL